MKALQRYIFLATLRPTLTILGGLSAMAILSQGLSKLELLMNGASSASTYIWVTLLATPQLISLLLPLALFFGVLVGINKLQTDNELAVSQAAGVSRLGMAMPVLRLATWALLLQLVLNLWIQPMAAREMRRLENAPKADIASALVKEGGFSQPSDALTVFCRRRAPDGGLEGLFVHDARVDGPPVSYSAEVGRIAKIEGAPALIMFNGNIQQKSEDGQLAFLQFDQYILDLSGLVSEERELILKPSDRYLPELFRPDLSNHYDRRNEKELLAEGHYRIASPLLNFAMVLLALLAIAGADFNRNGYGQRIGWAVGAAILVRVVTLAVQTQSADETSLNPLQYALPVMISLYFLILVLGARPKRRRRDSGTVVMEG